MRRLLTAVVGGLTIALTLGSAWAQETNPDTAPSSYAIRTSIKIGGLIYRTPETPEVISSRLGGQSLWRLRVEPEFRPRTNVTFMLAYEHRLQYASGRARLPTDPGQPDAQTHPFRVRPLDWTVTHAADTSWSHEIDRASIQFATRRATIVLGRQAIGWGRGVAFGAVDLFAPFSPLEVDREWRPGVDAMRLDLKLTDRSSIDVVSAFGRSRDASAVGARLRGYSGPVDVEIMGGRRARDVFGGISMSAAVREAEIHGELAAFRVPFESSDRPVIWKAVLGGSFRMSIGSGILTSAEYHYSGFGSPRPQEILGLLGNPRFSERYVRGDMQILSRHATAVSVHYEPSPQLTYLVQWVHNPRDRSGVVTPTVTYSISDRTAVLAAAHLPYGRVPRDWTLQSEFGAAPLAAQAQLRLYF